MIKVSPEVDDSYRGLVSIKNRDVAITPDCHFKLLDGGRLIEIQQAPVVNKPQKQTSGDDKWEKYITES